MKNKKNVVGIIVLILLCILPIAIIVIKDRQNKELKLDPSTKTELNVKEGEKPKIFTDQELKEFLKNAKDKGGKALPENIKIEKAEYDNKDKPKKITYTLEITDKDGNIEYRTLSFDIKYDEKETTDKPKEEKPTTTPEEKYPNTDADR